MPPTISATAIEFSNLRGLKLLLTGLLIVLIIAVCILSWVPPVSRDALTHHLAVPKLYLQHKGMLELPHIPFSYYPANLDLLYLLPLYFGNDILPKYIHFAFALLTAILLYVYLNRRLNQTYALLGVLIFLSTPIIVKLSTTVYVDLGLIFFSFGAICALFKWRASGFRTGYLLTAGVLCGLALGTKYNGLVTLFLLAMMTPLLYLRTRPDVRHRQLKALGYTIVFTTIALVVFSPWMIRNATWTGNPVYPLYGSLFNEGPEKKPDPNESSSNQYLQQEFRKRVQGWNHIAIRRIAYKESWLEIALIPVRIFFQGKDDQPKYFDGRLNPFLLMLPIAAFWWIDRKRAADRLEMRMLLMFVVFFILFAFLRTSIRIRYISPILPPLVILSVYGIHSAINRVNEWGVKIQRTIGRWAVITVAGLMLSLNFLYVFDQFDQVDPLSYISGEVSREEYISRYRSEYPMMQYVNQQTASDANILGLYLGNRRYYCNRKLVFGERLMAKAVITATSFDHISKELDNLGITHVIIRIDLFNQWARGLLETEQSKLIRFMNDHLQEIHRTAHHRFYILKNEQNSI